MADGFVLACCIAKVTPEQMFNIKEQMGNKKRVDQNVCDCKFCFKCNVMKNTAKRGYNIKHMRI